jgi:dTDP-4-dehydro-2,3,6-trideoxy-D-glucose 4-aminotransferase
VRDAARARRARQLAYHGLDDRSAFTNAAKVARRWWEFGIEEIGRRVIGNDLTAAIGSVQLRRLPGFVARRRVLTEAYDHLLAGVDGVRLPPPAPARHSPSYYFYWVQIDPAIRDRVAETLLGHGIYTTFRYHPLHRIPLYRSDAELPGTDQAAAGTLNLPLHQGLEDAEVRTVAAEFRAAVSDVSCSTTS